MKKKPKDIYGFEENNGKKSIGMPKILKNVLFVVFFPIILIWTSYLIIKIIEKIDE